MRVPRLSISNLMIAAGVIAVNFAAARALLSIHRLAFVGAVLIGLALQVGLFRLIRSRGHARNFWIGFVAAGSLALMCFVWAMLTPPTGMRQTNPSDRVTYYHTPGSAMWRLWCDYNNFAATNLVPLPGSYRFLGMATGNMPTATLAVIGFAPQVLIAALGGLLTWALGFAIERRHQRKHLAHPAMREVLKQT
jgi:membrane protein YqaA with SNARE-associated domain